MDENKVIQGLIYEIRGQKVIFDCDLAELYGVELRTLNQAVKRNIERFPADFMFQLTPEEWDFLRSQNLVNNLRSQTVISSLHGGRRYLPYVFTEQGIAMLSGVLKSPNAIEVNISIMRAFVKLRHFVLSQSGTNEQITELRKLLMLYIEKNDKRVNEIIIALNNLIEKPKVSTRIGFGAN